MFLDLYVGHSILYDVHVSNEQILLPLRDNDIHPAIAPVDSLAVEINSRNESDDELPVYNVIFNELLPWKRPYDDISFILEDIDLEQIGDLAECF